MSDGDAPATPPGSAVVVEGLTRRFGPLTAVDGLSFEVAPGELFGIVGPDGAGKTTTLRMLAGVLRADQGRIRLAGVDVVGDPERAKPRIAYMAQRFGLYEDLTVRENLDFYADLYRVPRNERPERLARLYEFSRLDEFEDRLAGNLSGGMKQKLALSCCLVHRPSVLLLDEPTFGVDPISRRDLWLILHEMVASGVTVVVSTAYMDEAERCDRVALLDKGRVLALEPPDALLERLPGRVIVARPAEPRAFRDAVRGLAGVRRASLFGDAVHVQVERDEDWSDVRATLESRGIDPGPTSPEPPSLEDVFIDLVAEADAGREVESLA